MPINVEALTSIGWKILTWLGRILLGLGVIALMYGLSWFIRRERRYNHNVNVYNTDAVGNIIQQRSDKGGIFIDRKTKYRLFLLKRNKFGLDPDKVPYIINYKGQRMVHLLQTGLKNYQYLKPQFSPNPGLVFDVQDEDVAWAMNAWERYHNPFKSMFLEHIIPFLGMAFVFLKVVIALWFIFKNFGTLGDVAIAMKEAAIAMKEAAIGTTVVAG